MPDKRRMSHSICRPCLYPENPWVIQFLILIRFAYTSATLTLLTDSFPKP